MKILIELPSWLGDAVMATPAIENIVNYYNQTEITIVGSFISIEMLKNHPKIVKSEVLDKKYKSLYAPVVKGYDKSKNSFMTNRFMSIKFPVQANMFNALKIDPVGQAEAWRMVASKFNRVPGFIYTKTKASKKTKKWELWG